MTISFRLRLIAIALLGTVYLHAGLNWTLRNQGPANASSLWGIGKGPAGLIACGTNGTILQSFDGQTWLPRDAKTSAWLLSVTYGNGHYIMVGDGGLILSSVDGVAWQQVGGGATTQRLNRVLFGHNKFVAVGENQTLLYSPDGTNWTAEYLDIGNGQIIDPSHIGWLRGLATNIPAETDASVLDPTEGVTLKTSPECWISAGQYGVILTSSDGQHWIYQTSLANQTFGSLSSPILSVPSAEDIEALSYRSFAARSDRLDESFSGAGQSEPVGSIDEIFGYAISHQLGIYLALDNPKYTYYYPSAISSPSPVRFRGSATNDLIEQFPQDGNSVVPTYVAAGESGSVYTQIPFIIPDESPAGFHTASGTDILAPNLNFNDAAFYNNSFFVVGDQRSIYQSTPVGTPNFTNISSRGFVGTGEQVMIAGTIISGTVPKKMLIRGLGPTLADYSVSGFLPDPQIQVFDQTGRQIAQVGAWSTSAGAQDVLDALKQIGSAPLQANRTDSAIVLTLPPGGYTFIVSSLTGKTGVALVDAFDLDQGNPPNNKVINVSTRAFVGPGEQTLIAGLIVDGQVAKRILLRGIGPLLTKSGVAHPLDNPVITVFDQSGKQIAANDDWGTVTTSDYVFGRAVSALETSTLMKSVGVTSLDQSPNEAAFVVKLNPGAYTVQVTSKTGASGTALVEAFELPY